MNGILWRNVALRNLLKQVSRPESVQQDKTYRILGAHWYAKGLYVKSEKLGADIKAKTLYLVKEDDFVYNRLFAWKGSFAVADNNVADCYVSNEFPCFTIDEAQIDATYLWMFFKSENTWNQVLGMSTGVTAASRNRLKEDRFLTLEIPLPPLEEQKRLAAMLSKVEDVRRLHEEIALDVNALIPALLSKAFRGEL